MNPMDNAIMEVNKLLLGLPFALTVVLMDDDGVSKYVWQDRSAKAKKARNEAVALLNAAWQSGAYNYQYIADRLRIDTLSVQGLIDEQFKAKTGL